MKIGVLTQEQANELFALLNDNHYQWFFRNPLTEETFWEVYKDETVYHIDLDEKIVSFSDRDWVLENVEDCDICGFYTGMAKLNELFKKKERTL